MAITAKLEGMIVSVVEKKPEGKQEFEPHQLLSVMQLDQARPQIIEVKDMDLYRKYTADLTKKVVLDCVLVPWQSGSRSGLSIKINPDSDNNPLGKK